MGAALHRRAAAARPDRGRLADRLLRPGHAGHPRPARGPHQDAGGDLLRCGRLPRALRRPVLPVGPAGRHRDSPGAGLGAREFGDTGRHRRTKVLQPRRVAVVRRPGLDAGRDDRPPRGGAGPRAGAVLHAAGAGHRPRRRRRGRRGRHPGRGLRGLRDQHGAPARPGRHDHRRPPRGPRRRLVRARPGRHHPPLRPPLALTPLSPTSLLLKPGSGPPIAQARLRPPYCSSPAPAPPPSASALLPRSAQMYLYPLLGILRIQCAARSSSGIAAAQLAGRISWWAGPPVPAPAAAS